MLSIPVFSFPTTVICVDDDKNFLDYLSAGIKTATNFNVKCFYDAEEALEFLTSYKSSLRDKKFLSSFTEHEYYDTSTHSPVDLDINSVMSLSKESSRHKDISILIADYDMPNIDGLELCSQLGSTEFKKILLTGEVDYERATNALNHGVIDCFIPKFDVSTFLPGVRSNVNSLEKRYFNEVTKNLSSHLEVSYSLPLSDPIFISFFNQLLEENRVQEFYLSDKNGSFLLVDDKGKHSCLVVQTERALDNLVDLYDDDDNVSSYMKSVKDRKKIPFFGMGKTLEQVNPTQLSGCFFTPKVVEGRERYYYHIVKL